MPQLRNSYGYYFALERCSDDREQELVAEWSGFCHWLAEKLEVVRPEQADGVLPGIWFMERLHRDCPDDRAALARLDDWWAEYWSSVRRESGHPPASR